VNIFNKLVYKGTNLHPFIRFSIRYRYLVFFIAAIVIWWDATSNEVNLVGLYSLIMIFLGIVFSNVWQGIFNSFLVTLCRYSFAPEGFPNIEITLFQWFSYFAIWFAVSSLIKRNIEQEENLIRLTTALANTLDSRDKYTAFHSINVAKYSELIAREMRLSEKFCNNVRLGALLHDIGKIGIPENILNKTDKLTTEEYEIIKTHPLIGYQMVKHISIFEKNGVLDAILYHHERENGSGYPKGLKGENIPIIAKIIAVADSFDAMTSNRVYRKEKSFSFAVNEIYKNRGNHYDPEVVDGFCRVINQQGESILDITDIRYISN
jgi:putative nucleotidyltransferase with HDIG domain